MARRKRKPQLTAQVARKKARRVYAHNRRAIEVALATFAHEVRTPLTGIIALSELIAASDLGERERRWVAALKDAAEHLSAFTSLVIDAARASTKGLFLKREPFDVRTLAESAATTLAARAEAKGLTCRTTIENTVPTYIVGDPVRLRAALENLFDNAVKFTEYGEVTLNVSARPAGRGRARLLFTVSDSGMGMTPAEMRRLFRPFAQANDSVARNYGGAGLGLTLVKQLAKALGGDLEVDSEPGRGSTFRLSIRAEECGERQAGARRTGSDLASARSLPLARGLNILCAEDNPYGRLILKTILTELGHHVDFVGAGEAAVAAVARGGYDVVLIDVILPGMDGIEATRRIRALAGRAGQIPIIGISGRTGDDEEARARACGMNGYLSKPVSPSGLSKILATVVGTATAS